MTRLAYLRLSFVLATSLSTAACGGTSPIPGSGLAPSTSGTVRTAQTVRNLHKNDPCAAHGCIYVGNEGNSVTVYSKVANGNVAPVQAITGADTDLDDVWAVAVDSARNIYAANYKGGNYHYGSVTVYAAGSTGDASPIATIYGTPGAETISPSGVGIDAAGNIYASGQSSNSVSVYPPGSNGPTTPSQYISGAATQLSAPDSLAVAAGGKIYITNNSSVTVYAAGTDGNVSPIQTISGSKTGIDNPNAVAVDSKEKFTSRAPRMDL